MKIKCLVFLVTLLAMGGSLSAQLSPASSSTGSITTNAANCFTTNACIVLHMATSNVGYSITVSGTWTGTLTFEQSGDNQTTWASAGTTTANTLFTSALTPGITDARVRSSAAMTGTAIITITASGPATIQNITQTGGSSGISSVSTLPATCTPGTTAPVSLTINGYGYGVFYCSSTNTFTPDNPQATVSPLAYGAKAGVKFVYDCTYTISTTINCNSGDAQFQCPGGVFPCTGATSGCPGATCDAGKIEFGTSGLCCVGPPASASGVLVVPQGTISTVNSATQIVVSIIPTATCTPSGAVTCSFAWGTQDDATAINAATAAAWNAGNTCKALQLPSDNMFFGSAIMIGTIGNACGTGGTVGGADLNSVGPEVYGQGQNNSVLIPLPSFNFATCTGGSAGTACIGGVPNLQAHDFGVNGLQQSLVGAPHSNVLFELRGQAAACSGGTSAQNLGLAGWGLNSSGTIGFQFASGGCNDAAVSNINVQQFGATPCNLVGNGATGNVLSVFALMCFGYTTAAVNVSGGTINSFGSMYLAPLASSTGVITCGGSNPIFNSFGDSIQAEFGAGAFVQTLLLCNGGSMTANFSNDNLFLSSGSAATSQVFFLNGTSTVHIRNSVVTATGANNRILFTGAGDKFFDDGGNTFLQGTLANSISGGTFGSNSTTGTTLLTGNVVISACGTSAASAFSGTSTKGQFTITFAGAPGANCTATVTFPTAFPFVAPICTWIDVGGTNAFPTSIVNGATSTTSTAMTETAAAFTNGNTEIMQYACAVP